MTSRGIGDQSQQLIEALAAAADPRDVALDLPDVVEGACDFTVVAGDLGDGTQAWDVAFDWDGESRHSPFWFDISGHEGTSPGSSSPTNGWVSWLSDGSIAIAFVQEELDVHGVAWGDEVTMLDPDTNETTTSPLDWARFGRSVVDGVMGVLREVDQRGRYFGPGVMS